MKEAVHLEDQLERDKQARDAAAKAKVREDRMSGREKLLSGYEQELREIMATSAGMSKQELEQKKADLRKKHQVCIQISNLFSTVTYVCIHYVKLYNNSEFILFIATVRWI